MAAPSARPVRVRMAPSPTGTLHIGTARTALFNWLFARHYGGTFVMRIEDTDKERSKKEFETDILTGLAWLGIEWDEGPTVEGKDNGSHGPYRQSERLDIYKKYLTQLLEKGEAYYCYCSKEDLEAQRQSMLAQGLPPKYSGRCRNLKEAPAGESPEVIRFKVPEIKVEFHDLIRGKVVFDAALLGDQVIAKDLDNPLYNFAVVVDDELMEISHVIRGEDHISNTPKQILLLRTLGFKEPTYAHIPLILNPDRSKMSKRFNNVAVSEYKAAGYLPETLINFFALLGWHPSGDKEVFSREELVKAFDLERVQQSGAIFNQEKLDWLNREHMKTLSDEELAEKVMALEPPAFESKPEKGVLTKIVRVERSRAATLREFATMGAFFFKLPEYEPKLLIWKETPKNEIVKALKDANGALTNIAAENFTRETLSQALSLIIGERSRGIVLWPVRVALSGEKASPDPIEIMEVLGKEESLRRLGIATTKLDQ